MEDSKHKSWQTTVVNLHVAEIEPCGLRCCHICAHGKTVESTFNNQFYLKISDELTQNTQYEFKDWKE